MTAGEAAKEIFLEAWKLYVKYQNGPQGDKDTYWHNLAIDADKVALRWPCGFAEDIVKAVIAEHDRRERNK